MTKKIITILIILAVILLILITVSPQKISTFIQQIKQKPIVQQNTTQIAVPIPLNHPNYYDAVIVYTLTGDIDQINFNTKQLTLKSNPPLPTFSIDNNTKVVKSTGQTNTTPIILSSKELKSGIKVSISAIYSLKSKDWTIPYITVIPPQDAQVATSSSNLNP